MDFQKLDVEGCHDFFYFYCNAIVSKNTDFTMNPFYINRRAFLKTSSASLAVSMLGLSGLDALFPEKNYRVGLIGAGWYGKSDLCRLIQVSPVEVVAICDADQHMLDGAIELISQRQISHKKPVGYRDYRKMLAEQELDIVLIGTPDHWHALTAIAAMKAGAHVYVQKPISVDVLEGEAMVAAARKYKRTVQVGLQRRSTPHLMDAKAKIVDAGMLGKISHVELCCYYHMRSNDNPPVQPVPDFFDYETWTGPAPMRPFLGLPHRGWRTYIEYGNGIVGDMCVHMFDATRWLLGLGWPDRVRSTGGIYVQKGGKSTISDTQTAWFEYPELTCVWTHRTWGTPADPDYPWAFKIYGEKGTLMGDTIKYDFVPVGRDQKPVRQDVLYEREQFPEDLTEKDIELHAAPATRGQMINFLGAIADGSRPVADIEEGHISSASCILANVSMDLGGRTLAYDPVAKTIPGDAEATERLARKYREGWERPTF